MMVLSALNSHSLKVNLSRWSYYALLQSIVPTHFNFPPQGFQYGICHTSQNCNSIIDLSSDLFCDYCNTIFSGSRSHVHKHEFFKFRLKGWKYFIPGNVSIMLPFIRSNIDVKEYKTKLNV